MEYETKIKELIIKGQKRRRYLKLSKILPKCRIKNYLGKRLKKGQFVCGMFLKIKEAALKALMQIGLQIKAVEVEGNN